MQLPHRRIGKHGEQEKIKPVMQSRIPCTGHSFVTEFHVSSYKARNAQYAVHILILKKLTL